MIIPNATKTLFYACLALGLLLTSAMGLAAARPGSVSAAAVRCYAGTAAATAETLDCNRSGYRSSLLDFANVQSLSQLADRCFAIDTGGYWEEFDCSGNLISDANDARCIKEDVEAGRYREMPCFAVEAAHDYEQKKCYAVTEDNQVLELECNGDDWVRYISGSYAGGANSSAVTYNDAPTTCTGGDISDPDNCPIVGYIVLAINILSGAVGLIITAVIIASGIQYSSSRDDPQAVAAAKGRIYSAVLALAIFIFSWTILQWLVPGGVLNT